jgi:superoxide dismutase, Cu-Zn family
MVDSETHEGDLGNIHSDATGNADFDMLSAVDTTLILGRGLIVHSGRDEGSRSQPAGNSGPRLAQCVLGRTDITIL